MRGPYWDFVNSYHAVRHQDNIHVVTYEDMLQVFFNSLKVSYFVKRHLFWNLRRTWEIQSLDWLNSWTRIYVEMIWPNWSPTPSSNQWRKTRQSIWKKRGPTLRPSSRRRSKKDSSYGKGNLAPGKRKWAKNMWKDLTPGFEQMNWIGIDFIPQNFIGKF